MQMFVPLIEASSIIVAETRENVVSYTRQRTLGAHRLNKLDKKVKII